MKFFLFIPLVLIACTTCNAQKPPQQLPIPIEEMIDYMNNDVEINDGAYFKDVNNVLDKYVGTWVGVYDNKTYEFQLMEFTDNYLGISEDKILMRYKITDSNGNVIESTLGLPDESPYVIKGYYLSENEANYILTYISQQPCTVWGHIYINVMNNGTTMRLFLMPDPEVGIGENCINGLSSIFPTPTSNGNSIVLSKQ